MKENQRGGAEHGKNTEQQGHARRQRGGRDQNRPEEQEGKWILQPSSEKKERRKLGNVEAQEKRGAVGLKPLRLGKTHAQRDVEEPRERDHGETRPDRNIEFEAEMHHHDSRDLTEDGKPAQPHQRVEPHVAWPMIGPWQSEHTG